MPNTQKVLNIVLLWWLLFPSGRGCLGFSFWTSPTPAFWFSILPYNCAGFSGLQRRKMLSLRRTWDASGMCLQVDRTTDDDVVPQCNLLWSSFHLRVHDLRESMVVEKNKELQDAANDQSWVILLNKYLFCNFCVPGPKSVLETVRRTWQPQAQSSWWPSRWQTLQCKQRSGGELSGMQLRC